MSATPSPAVTMWRRVVSSSWKPRTWLRARVVRPSTSGGSPAPVVEVACPSVFSVSPVWASRGAPAASATACPKETE